MPKGDDILAIKSRRLEMVQNAHIAEQEKQLRDTQTALNSLKGLYYAKEAANKADAEGQKENESLRQEEAKKVNKVPPRIDRSKGKP